MLVINAPLGYFITMEPTILIVDDNPYDMEITKIALEEVGCEVKLETAFRGKDALAYLREGQDLPSLILLDLKMPGMSGIDTLRQIRADERLKHIPVIIVTSSSLEADEKEAYEAGANSFLHKAFSIDQFSGNLDDLLKRFLNN